MQRGASDGGIAVDGGTRPWQRSTYQCQKAGKRWGGEPLLPWDPRTALGCTGAKGIHLAVCTGSTATSLETELQLDHICLFAEAEPQPHHRILQLHKIVAPKCWQLVAIDMKIQQTGCFISCITHRNCSGCDQCAGSRWIDQMSMCTGVLAGIRHLPTCSSPNICVISRRFTHSALQCCRMVLLTLPAGSPTVIPSQNKAVDCSRHLSSRSADLGGMRGDAA